MPTSCWGIAVALLQFYYLFITAWPACSTNSTS